MHFAVVLHGMKLLLNNLSVLLRKKINDAETKRKLLNEMREVNEMIVGQDFRLGEEYQLGGAIFAKYVKYQDEDNSFNSLWNNYIAVILSEYLRGQRDKECKLEKLKIYTKKRWGYCHKRKSVMHEKECQLRKMLKEISLAP